MSLEEFVKTHHPHVLLEYQRSLLRWEDLRIGMIVVTLRAGFCGRAGELRVIKDFGCHAPWHYATLDILPTERYPVQHTSLLYKEQPDKTSYWWKDVAIINYDHYKTLSWHDQTKYLNTIAGFIIA